MQEFSDGTDVNSVDRSLDDGSIILATGDDFGQVKQRTYLFFLFPPYSFLSYFLSSFVFFDVFSFLLRSNSSIILPWKVPNVCHMEAIHRT